MRFAEGRERSHSPRIGKTGSLCQLLYDGRKMELRVVSGDAVSDQKVILTEKKHMSLKHLASRMQWHFQRKTEFGGGCPEVSISLESGPHTCSLYYPTV